MRGVAFLATEHFFFPLWRSLTYWYSAPLFPCVIDLESTAEHIRGVLGGSAPEVQRQLLQELLDSVTAHAGPSIDVAENYVKTFRHLLFQPFFRMLATRRPRGIMALCSEPRHGTGFLHRFRKK